MIGLLLLLKVQATASLSRCGMDLTSADFAWWQGAVPLVLEAV